MKKSKDPEMIPLLYVGTGFFISRDGYVITNAIVSADVTDLWVEMQNRCYEAVLIGNDLTTNLSILKINGLPSDVPYLTFDETDDLVEPGTMIASLSYPFDMNIELLTGFITSLNVEVSGVSLPTTHLRSDIPCHGGEMGAPVFDLNGKLIGIKAGSLMGFRAIAGSITEDIGGCLILPSRAAMRIRDDLIFRGKVSYGYIGIKLDKKEIFETGKLVIENVDKNSPANYGGVRAGDEILQFNQQKIEKIGDLCNAVFFAQPGQYLNMKIKRSGREVGLTIKMDENTAPFLLEEVEKETEIGDETITHITQKGSSVSN